MSDIYAEDHLDLVRHILFKYYGGGNNFRFMGFEPDDLFQIGAIGLIKAVENFNPDYGFKFSTYASSVIHGEIRREIRDSGRLVKFPRGVNEIVGKIAKSGKKESITIDEIMTEYKVDREYAGMVLTRLFYNTTSGDKTFSDSEGEGSTSLFDTMEDQSVDVESDVLNPIELENRLSILDERSEKVMRLSLEGNTQNQVADIIGVSQMQISRIIRKSLKKIEERFDNVITT